MTPDILVTTDTPVLIKGSVCHSKAKRCPSRGVVVTHYSHSANPNGFRFDSHFAGSTLKDLVFFSFFSGLGATFKGQC